MHDQFLINPLVLFVVIFGYIKFRVRQINTDTSKLEIAQKKNDQDSRAYSSIA